MKDKDKNSNLTGSLEFAGGRCGVLLIHSLGGNPIELRFVAQALARDGYTVRAAVRISPACPSGRIGTPASKPPTRV